MSRCTFIKDTGERCGAHALGGEQFCLFHSPAHAEEVDEARRLGGYRRRREKAVSIAYDFEGLRTIADILRVLESAVVDTLALESSVPRSRALAQLCEIARRCHDDDVEEQVRVLEAIIRSRKLPGASAFETTTSCPLEREET
jgi:hypothetical protein